MIGPTGMRCVLAALVVWAAVATGCAVPDLDFGGGRVEAEVDIRPMAGAPILDRTGAPVVWTGSEMIVWGGRRGDKTGDDLGDGAAYDPVTDSWRTIAPSPLAARHDHSAVWVGGEMVVFGGVHDVFDVGQTNFFDAAAYNPADDTWRPIPGPDEALIGSFDIPALAADEAVAGDGLVFLPGTNHVLTLEPTDGVWQRIELDVPDISYQSASFTAHDDTIYLVAHRHYQGQTLSDAVVAALHPSTGEVMSVEVVPEAGASSVLVSLADGPALLARRDQYTAVLTPNGATWTETAELPLESFAVGESANPTVVAGRYLALTLAQDLVLVDRTSLETVFAPADFNTTCALGDRAVWTGQDLLGWNATGCERVTDDGNVEITGGVVVTLP